MNQSNLINEGFFNKISKFLKDRPKVKGKKKLGVLKSLKLALGISGLNKAIDDFEKASRKHLGKDFPKDLKVPRFEPSDFIK